MVEVVVRDGRIGRDPSQDTDEGGAILTTLQRGQPFEVGERLILPDGTEVKVIGDKETINPAERSWKQTVFVGNVP